MSGTKLDASDDDDDDDALCCSTASSSPLIENKSTPVDDASQLATGTARTAGADSAEANRGYFLN